jgi:choice-of-anchor C domain-containing protein
MLPGINELPDGERKGATMINPRLAADSANPIRAYAAIAVLLTLLTALILSNQPSQVTSARQQPAPLAAATGPCVPAAGNLVQNGSFEMPEVGEGATYIAPASFPGWEVAAGSVDIVGPWEDADGAQSLDLAGYAPGTIYQDLCTVPGMPYQLSFALAGNPNDPPGIKTMEVWWGDQQAAALSFDISGHTGSSMGWTIYEYTLQASSGTTRLLFKDSNPGASIGGPALDAIGVLAVAATPTPTSPPTATATVPGSQQTSGYLPMLLSAEAAFPIAINQQAIAAQPIQALGAVYYSMTLALPQTLPAGGRFYLSAAPDSLVAVKVDDELAVVLDGQDGYVKFLTDPLIVEVARAELEQWSAAQSARVEFRDRYGAAVSSSPVWLIWIP